MIFLKIKKSSFKCISYKWKRKENFSLDGILWFDAGLLWCISDTCSEKENYSNNIFMIANEQNPITRSLFTNKRHKIRLESCTVGNFHTN